MGVGVVFDADGFRVAKLRVAFVEAMGAGVGAEVVRLWCWTGRWDRDEGGAQREAWRFGPSMAAGGGLSFGVELQATHVISEAQSRLWRRCKERW